jgi:muconolactone delta-isomerase
MHAAPVVQSMHDVSACTISHEMENLMKYLLTTQSRIGHNAFKPDNPQAVFKAAHEWSTTNLNNGNFDCVYGFADGRGGVSIVNADSHEDLLQMIRSSPMYHYIDYDIRPLCDLQLLWDLQIQAAKHHGAA